MRPRTVLAGIAAVCLIGLPRNAQAQSVTGTVVNRSGRAVPGVVVILVDAADSVVSRGMTRDDGAFRLAAGLAGMYRLRTLRLGFRPTLSPAIALTQGSELTERIQLTDVAIALDTVRVTGRSTCQVASDSAAAPYAIWEQARMALTATMITARDRGMGATIVTFERVLERDFRRVRHQTSTIRSGLSASPWRSRAPDSLRHSGYVTTGADGWSTYYAPDLGVLLSHAFVEDHCFKLEQPKDNALLGLSFEPTRDRSDRPEIRGTLWLDRKTAELRALEFKYVNVSEAQMEGRAGGAMEFTRLRTGAWAISRWSIRMPVVVQTGGNLNLGIPGAAPRYQMRVTEIRVAGGELASVTRGSDTVWAHAPVGVSGTVVDSVTGVGLPGASLSLAGTALQTESAAGGAFSIQGAIPGEYILEVRTTSLDSVGVVHQLPVAITDAPASVTVRVPPIAPLVARFCPEGSAPRGAGLVVGRVRIRDDTTSARGVAVAVRWIDASVKNLDSDVVVGQMPRVLLTQTDARGVFRLCGVPLNTPALLRTALHEDNVPSMSVLVLPNRRLASVDVLVDARPPAAVAGTAVLIGQVVTDSTFIPVEGAEIVIADANLMARTGASGAFRLPGVPAGSHPLVVRHVGHRPFTADLDVGRNQTLVRDFVLRRHVVALDSITVRAGNRLTEFEQQRRTGNGRFFDRAELAPLEHLRMSELFGRVSGARIVRGTGTESWVAQNRGIAAASIPTISRADSARGAMRACYSDVWLNGSRVYSAGDLGQALFDINTIAVRDVESLEYYASDAQTPVRYSRPGLVCGVVAIRTRVGG